MAELAGTAVMTRVRRRWFDKPKREHEDVPFPELVLIHFLRQIEVFRTRAFTSEWEAPLQHKLRAFRREHGTVLRAYWCTGEPSAVLLTERGFRSWQRLWRLDTIVRLHAETDWITRDEPAIAAEVRSCQMLAIRVGELLRGTSERVALQGIVRTMESLLGAVDQCAVRPLPAETVRTAVESNRKELAAIDRYYVKSAENQARIVYFHGMVQGAVFLAALAGAVTGALYLSGFSRWNEPATYDVLVAIGMGALGAIVSVLSRMSGKGAFSIDHEIGRKAIRRLGSFRPFIGATFALALYFGVDSGVIPLGSKDRTFSFYAIISFLAGFSERWAKVLLDTASGDKGSPAAAAPGERPEEKPQATS